MPVFSWLDVSFLFRTIGCTTAYLFIHLLKETISVMSKAAINTSMQVLCGYTFSTYLNKYQGM